MAKIVGYVVLTILGLAVLAFVGIGIASTIVEGGFFDLFRQWFNVVEEVAESTPPETGETVATIGRTLKSV